MDPVQLKCVSNEIQALHRSMKKCNGDYIFYFSPSSPVNSGMVGKVFAQCQLECIAYSFVLFLYFLTVG